MDIDMEIRHAIDKQMRTRNLKQTDLAEKLGITRQSVSAVISGRRGTIPSSLTKILDALDLELTVKQKDSSESSSQ